MGQGNTAIPKGFGELDGKKIRRIIGSVEGKEKHGKTSFALSAPGPIALIDMDTGLEGVVEKYIPLKKIYTASFNYRDATDKNEWEAMWKKVKDVWNSAMESKSIRTIVADTATEMWELARLAKFGKLSDIKPHHYGPVNAEYRDLIRSSYSSGKNVILLHKLKKEYVNDKYTGRMERSGFSDMGYLVQVVMRVEREGDNEYMIKVKECRQNAELVGSEYPEPLNTFPCVAAQVFPDTKEEDWE